LGSGVFTYIWFMKKLFFLIGSLLFVFSGFSQELETEVKTDKMETAFDTRPEFPGGAEALYKFISQNVIYPADAMEAEIQGRVMVQFLVDEEGNVKDAVIQQSISPSLDREALRVVRSMPKWKPGMLDGKPVSAYFRLPITFKLQE